MIILHLISLVERRQMFVRSKDEEAYANGDFVLIKNGDSEVLAKVLSPEKNKAIQPHPGMEISRKLTDEEVETWKTHNENQKENLIKARNILKKHDLKMQFFAVFTDLKDEVLHFYFTSDAQVDFRDMLKEMHTSFAKRIFLWRVPPKVRVKMLDGFGSCGRPDCCMVQNFSSDKTPTIDDLKDQGIIIKNNDRMFDSAGRIRPCFGYEKDFYIERKKYFPHIKQRVKVKDREGRVIGMDLFTTQVRVLFDKTFVESFDISEVEYPQKIEFPKDVFDYKFADVDIWDNEEGIV